MLQYDEEKRNLAYIATDSVRDIKQIDQMKANMENTNNKLKIIQSSNTQLDVHHDELSTQMNNDREQYKEALNDTNVTLHKCHEEKMKLRALIQTMLDSKLSFDAEIFTYKRLLEELEKRFEWLTYFAQLFFCLQMQYSCEYDRNWRRNNRSMLVQQID